MSRFLRKKRDIFVSMPYLNDLYFSFNSFCMMSHVLLFTSTPSQYERKFETTSSTCDMIPDGLLMSFSTSFLIL